MNKYRLKKGYVISALVIAAICLFSLVFVGSYAFFTTRVTTKDYVIYTGSLKVDYTRNSNLINLTKEYPKTNTQGLATTGYSFTVTNNGTINAKYLIRLELDSSNTLPNEYIKFSLTKTQENSVQVNQTIEPTLLSNLNNLYTILDDQSIESTKEDSYTLKLWIDYSAPVDIEGKTFKAKIVVDSVQESSDSYVLNDVRPIITLNKNSNGNTDINLIKNDQFNDPGILSVKDDKDILAPSDVDISYQYTSNSNNLTLTTVNSIDTSQVGVYYITYTVTDSANNTGTAVRVVTVNNTATIPTISLVGSSTINMGRGIYTEPGVTVANNNKVATIGEVKANTTGTYIVRYIVIDNKNNINSITRTVNVNEINTWDFDYTGNVETFTPTYNGKYKFELWGAQGGTTNEAYAGGYGGYVSGNINLNTNDNFYVYVGQIGQLGTTAFNGGGEGSISAQYGNGAGGGGATDIRTTSGTWDSFDSLKSRIIVAAGGGGGGFLNSDNGGNGGSGGGLTGLYSNRNVVNPEYLGKRYSDYGGSQTSAGRVSAPDRAGQVIGGFGYGGSWTTDNNGGSGGGGGYYGGGPAVNMSGASGGSSFISGHNGCNAISNASTSSNIIHTNQSVHYSEYSFTETKMIDGDGHTWSTQQGNIELMPNPNGGFYASETGNINDGHVTITYIGN